MKKFLPLTVIAFICLLFSCATGNALVTGNQRPAINASEVVIYAEAPEQYEIIGIVSASSDATGDSQTDLNYAVAELNYSTYWNACRYVVS